MFMSFIHGAVGRVTHIVFNGACSLIWFEISSLNTDIISLGSLKAYNSSSGSAANESIKPSLFRFSSCANITNCKMSTRYKNNYK